MLQATCQQQRPAGNAGSATHTLSNSYSSYLTGLPGSSTVMRTCSRRQAGHALVTLLLFQISPANVVGKAHWYSDKLTVRGMVPWKHTMVRIPAGAKCEWWWARVTTLIKTLCQKKPR
jgi:hypothetical protein